VNTTELCGSAPARVTYARTGVAFSMCNTAVTAPSTYPFAASMAMCPLTYRVQMSDMHINQQLLTKEQMIRYHFFSVF
jgi:hypothetical protein